MTRRIPGALVRLKSQKHLKWLHLIHRSCGVAGQQRPKMLRAALTGSPRRHGGTKQIVIPIKIQTGFLLLKTRIWTSYFDRLSPARSPAAERLFSRSNSSVTCCIFRPALLRVCGACCRSPALARAHAPTLIRQPFRHVTFAQIKRLHLFTV